MAIIVQRAELPKAATPSVEVLERQTTTAETAIPHEEKKEEIEKPLSPHYVALARREKALRREAQALKAERDAFKLREAEVESSYVSKKSLLERAQSDPQALMQELGLSYEQLTNLILNQSPQTDPTLQKLVEKVQAIETTQAKTLTQMEEQQKRSYDQAVTQIRNEAKILIDSDEQFETIKEENASEVVVALIEETFEKEGLLLSVMDAAKQVEEFLIEEALRKAKFKKVQQLLNPTTLSNTETKKIQPDLVQKQMTPMKTLTHAHTASSGKSFSEKDRVQRAILAFKGQLQ